MQAVRPGRRIHPYHMGRRQRAGRVRLKDAVFWLRVLSWNSVVNGMERVGDDARNLRSAEDGANDS